MAETQPCMHKKQEVKRSELPLCCPTVDERLWDAHPRVYLPIEKTGEAVCPYCETAYHLIDG